jgi:hypothetical protein
MPINTANAMWAGIASKALDTATDRPYAMTYFTFSNAAKPKDTNNSIQDTVISCFKVRTVPCLLLQDIKLGAFFNQPTPR